MFAFSKRNQKSFFICLENKSKSKHFCFQQFPISCKRKISLWRSLQLLKVYVLLQIIKAKVLSLDPKIFSLEDMTLLIFKVLSNSSPFAHLRNMWYSKPCGTQNNSLVYFQTRFVNLGQWEWILHSFFVQKLIHHNILHISATKSRPVWLPFLRTYHLFAIGREDRLFGARKALTLCTTIWVKALPTPIRP